MQANRTAIGAIVARDQAAAYRRVKHLVISKREGAAGSSPTYFVKTSAKQVYQFGQEEYLLCQLLDGKRSFPDIQSEFKRQLGHDLTREQFDGLLAELLECGIVEPDLGLQGAAGRPLDDELKTPADEPDPDRDDIDAALDAAQLPGAARDPFAIRLFNPAVPLQALDWLTGPLRYYRWLLLPVAFACVIMATLNVEAMGKELFHVAHLPPARAILIAVAALLIVDLVPTIGQATLASFLGHTSQACGMVFRFFLLPRLRFSDADWGNLSAARALQVAAAPLTIRLALFTAGTATWLLTRQAGGWLAPAALVVGLLALFAVAADAAPFATNSGRKWLTTLFGRSDLWRVGGFYRAHLLALSVLWVLAFAGVVALLLSAAAHAGGGLGSGSLGSGSLGSGVLGSGLAELRPVLDTITLPMLTIIPVAGWLWLRGTVKSQVLARVVYQPADGFSTSLAGLPAIKPPGIVVPFDRDALPGRRRPADPWPAAKTAIILATVLALVEAFGFVPYPYEAGGNFTILPHDSSKLNARVQGELTEVLVNEGDWVTPGRILGILSDWDQQANLAVSKAQLENAKASLQALYETPKPEDVELARKQYELAASRIPYDKAQYDRAAYLVKTDAVSHQNYDQILSQYQQDQAAAEVARANYDDVRAGPTPGQLDAARALVRQYAATVAYNEDQLERTRIRATAYGTVVTPNPMLMRGQWFGQGALVFTVQDLRTVQADVQVPETDIGHVVLNGVVRLRPWGYPETTFPGTSIAIAGDAQPDPGGSGTNVIRVRAELPNPEGALHANMTGYAKLTGLYMPAWQAFVQMIIRFFLITIWSFIP